MTVLFRFLDTTRPKKPGEEEGKEYHFVSHDDMTALITAGKMIEFGEYKGHLYGTSSDSVSYVFSHCRNGTEPTWVFVSWVPSRH